MAQAAENPTTTRRRFLIGTTAAAATLSTAAAVAAPTSPTVDPIWGVLHEAYVNASCEVDTATRRHEEANEAVEEWERRNRLREPHYASLAERLDDFPRLRAAEQQWQTRYENAMRNSGRGRKAEARSEAIDRLQEAAMRVIRTEPTNIYELECKAHTALIDHDPNILISLAMNVATIARGARP